VYFNVNFNVFFKLIKVYLLVRKLYISALFFEVISINSYFKRNLGPYVFFGGGGSL